MFLDYGLERRKILSASCAIDLGNNPARATLITLVKSSRSPSLRAMA
jgi:hypothetical protein